MHAVSALSLLALAGSALAAPVVERDIKVVYETAVYTVIVTAQPGVQAAATPAPQPHRHHHPKPKHSSKKVSTTVVYVQQPSPKPEPPKYTPAPAPAPAPKPSSAAPPPPPASSAPATPPPSTGGYMDVVNEWRGKLGMASLTHDTTLENNACKTVQDGNGVMKHELNPGSFAQVLAPGKPEDFTHCFVGGWLCEKPNLPGLNGICSTQSSGWMYTSTGHADILTNTGYKKIGCCNKVGIWGCDLA